MVILNNTKKLFDIEYVLMNVLHMGFWCLIFFV